MHGHPHQDEQEQGHLEPPGGFGIGGQDLLDQSDPQPGEQRNGKAGKPGQGRHREAPDDEIGAESIGGDRRLVGDDEHGRESGDAPGERPRQHGHVPGIHARQGGRVWIGGCTPDGEAEPAPLKEQIEPADHHRR